MKTRIFVIISIAALFASCSLEEVKDSGQTCPPNGADPNAKLLYINTPECTIDSDSILCQTKYHDFFDLKRCPADIKYCMKQDDINFYCAESKEVTIIDRCPAQTIECKDDKDKSICVDPTSNTTCGANSCEDFGEDCTSTDRTCISGTCQCPKGTYFCDNKCIHPSDENYCGIRANCSDEKTYENCAGKPDGTYRCLKREDAYVCELSECKSNQNSCKGIDGNDFCIDKSDIRNCGSCDNDCTLKMRDHAKGSECRLRVNDEGEQYLCTYQCDDNTINCGSAFDPNCVDTTSNSENCGSCGLACNSNERCIASNCVAVACQDTECLNNETGKCGNSHEKCGRLCTTCGDDQICNNQGLCAVTSCSENAHILYRTDGSSVCENNTVTQCASNHNSSNDEIVNCSTAYTNANTTCDHGVCKISSCENGYHKVSEGGSEKCVQDSLDACGSSETPCPKTAGTVYSCVYGKCEIIGCQDNYHLVQEGTTKRCDPYDAHYCGPNGINCLANNVASATCENKACVIKSCRGGYDLYQNECLEINGKRCAKDGACGYYFCMLIPGEEKCVTGTECVNRNTRAPNGVNTCYSFQEVCTKSSTPDGYPCMNKSSSAIGHCEKLTCVFD